MPRRNFPETVPSVETHRDLRSHAHAVKRQSKQSVKYYNYRGVHASWIGQPYHSLPRTLSSSLSPYFGPFHWSLYPACDPLISYGAHMKVATWTKRDMWLDRETNIWPLDRRHHVGKRIREKTTSKYNERDLGRRMKQKVQSLEFVVEDARFEDVGDDFEGLDDDSILYGIDFHCSVCCCASEAGQWSVNEASVEEVDLDSPFLLGIKDDEISEDEDGFNIVSERDFDVLSISSMEGDDDGPT